MTINFPTGAGLVSLCLFILLIAISKIVLKSNNVFKVILRSISVLCLLYFIVGICTIFKFPYYSTGEVYFNTNAHENIIESYFFKNFSTEEIISEIFPSAKVYNSSKIVYIDGSECKIERRNWITPKGSIIDIRIYSFNTDSQAIDAYDNALDIACNDMPNNFIDKLYIYTGENNEENDICILPIKYDGIRFLWPFIESNGSNFSLYFRCNNSYVYISENSTEKQNLVLPEIILEQS